jgi:integrase
MSVYKRGSVWYFLFYLHGKRFKGSTGIRVQGRSNERKAREIEAERKREAMAGEPVTSLRPERAPVVRDFIAEFSQWVETINKAPKTRADYLNGCRLILASSLAGMRLDHVTADDISATKFHDSPYSTNCALRTLRRALHRAMAKDQLRKIPKVKLVDAPRRERMVTVEDESRLLIAIEHAATIRRYQKRPASPLKEVLTLMLDTGMRPSEVVRMRIEQIDTRQSCYFNARGKTARARRVVPLSDRVMPLLKARSGDRREGWVFPSNKTKAGHVELRGLQKHFREIAQQLALPNDLKLYCARHTFGTVAMAETRDPGLVKEAMGHVDLKTTMGYMHPDVQRVKAVIDRHNESKLVN